MSGQHPLRWGAFGAVVALVAGGGTLAVVRAAGSGSRSVFVPISPCRLLDTRPAPDNVGPRTTPIGPGEALVVTVRGTNGNCTIPSDATAIVINTTAIGPTAPSFVTLFPADVARPLAANLNTVAGGAPTPNLVTVQLSSAGEIKIFNLAGKVDIAGDVTGFFAPEGASGTGPAGPPGPAGSPGATGPTGPAGPSGPAFGRRVIISTVADDPANPVGFGTSITIGVDGLPIISHGDVIAFDLRVTHCNDAACTTSTTTALDTASNAGFGTSIAIGSDGLPVIAHQESATNDLHVTHCGNISCTVGTTTTPDTSGGSQPSIAIGVDGFPVISHQFAGDLRVTKCNDVACDPAVNGPETQTTVDHLAGGTVGQESSIVIGVDGNPVIAHFNNGATNLRVTKCNDPACSGSGEISTDVDASGGITGRNPSIAIGLDGNPVISYLDQSNAQLRVARCNDPGCVGGNETLSTVVAAQSNGETSIIVGPDGNPIISHTSAVGSDLDVTYCNDPACAGGDDATVVAEAVADGVGRQSSITIADDGSVVVSHRDVTATTLHVTHLSRRSWTATGWDR
jgi:hypothetical protein